MQVSGNLIYEEKTILLDINEAHLINKDKLTYVDQNEKQTGLLKVGDIELKVENPEIVAIEEGNKIRGLKEGKTKLEINDITNGTTVKVYIQVVNKVKVDVQEGQNFTVALKQNGTVWSYGLNDKGQLRKWLK